MPKKKINKSVSKRFKMTKTGKVIFAHQNQGHLKINRSQRRNRRGNVPGVLSNNIARRVKKMLGAQ